MLAVWPLKSLNHGLSERKLELAIKRTLTTSTKFRVPIYKHKDFIKV